MFPNELLAGKWRQSLGHHSSLSSLKSVSSSVVTGLRAGLDSLKVDSSDKQTVTFVRFCRLQYASEGTETYHRVLLLGYSDGFQVWDLEDERLVRELASKRDGAVRCFAAADLVIRWSADCSRPPGPALAVFE